MATKRPAAIDTAKSRSAKSPQLTLRDIDNLMKSPRFDKFEALALYDECNAETQLKLSRELLLGYLSFHRLPAADRMLATGGRIHHCRSSNSDKFFDSKEYGKAEPDEIDIFADPYEVKDYFLKRWISADPDMEQLAYRISTNGFKDASRGVRWETNEIFTAPGTRGFSHSGDYGGIPDYSEFCSSWKLISSHLMLYRLTTVLGMPPFSENEQVDGYKTAWAYTLHWIPDLVENQNGGKVMTSSFCIADHKGSIAFHFTGSEEASKAALLLLEWLFSDNVPHTYEGVMAGNQALTFSS